MPDEPIKAVELMRSLRRALDRRYRGLSMAERVRKMQEELKDDPLYRKLSRRARRPARVRPS